MISQSNIFKSYFNNISRIENSKSCFICVDCPSSISYYNWYDFKSHKCGSQSSSYFECIYCGLLVLWKHGERHINAHLKYRNENIYNCPQCIFSCNNDCRFRRHILMHSEISSDLTYRCSGCDKLFTSAERFIQHVNLNTVFVYNCCVRGCFVKSCHKLQMCEHYKRIHPTQAINFEINLILACSERTPDIEFTCQLIDRLPSQAAQLIIGRCNATRTPTTASSYLECFQCNFSTIKWHNFIRHYFQCGSVEKLSNVEHCIYICSNCALMSTKKHLVDEHLLECHGNATTLTEILPPRSDHHPKEIVMKEEVNKPQKRSRSISNDSRRMSKRQRINDSPDSKGETDEAVMSDYAEENVCPELVLIPFDEDGFRSNNPGQKNDIIISKMRQFSQTKIKIIGKENYGRIPECPECRKIFTYGFGDFKRHFITVHLNIEKDAVKDCLKYTKLPKAGEKFREVQEMLLTRGGKPVTLDNDRVRVPLSYSSVVFQQLIAFLTPSMQENLTGKMNVYNDMSIIVQSSDTSRRFFCHQCSYSSPYAFVDVQKHVMVSHCGISSKHVRYCLQASQLDAEEFLLLADDAMLNLKPDTKPKNGKLLISPLKNSTPKSATHRTRYQKWSKAGKKTANISPIKSEKTNCHSFGGRKGVSSLHLNTDSDHKLSLPVSEIVLRTLLQQVIPGKQIPGIIQKMKFYSNYSLTRLCQNERTVAFQCPCGRVFHTSRVPDLKIRAATLADARRHVMGVHAKIPQSLITVCCQASRICRENDFQIYSDEMLLQLASERQGKLPDFQLPTTVVCEADSSAEFGEQNSPGAENDPTKKNSFLTRISPDKEITHAKIVLKTDEPLLENATVRLDNEEGKIERVIHLPYSVEALKCLTEGYCEPTFFPDLEEKMSVYSKYRIFIIRRDGRKIFCCSGCSLSSPHGMGDVKKHILGVHAKIPERFKAAAMHCSRLSREDNTLLPDHLLLQLAKMKWKGSVIRPLAELKIEEHSVKEEYSRTEEFSMKEEYNRKEEYSKKEDSREMITIDSDSEIIVPEDFFVEMKQEELGGIGYKCSICEYESRFVGNSKAHIVREHLGIPAHTCTICEQLFDSHASVVAHHEHDHAGVDFVLTHYGPYKVAMSRINVRNTKNSPDKGGHSAEKKGNIFLQNNQDLSDCEFVI